MIVVVVVDGASGGDDGIALVQLQALRAHRIRTRVVWWYTVYNTYID